jgi:hypothetical protein
MSAAQPRRSPCAIRTIVSCRPTPARLRLKPAGKRCCRVKDPFTRARSGADVGVAGFLERKGAALTAKILKARQLGVETKFAMVKCGAEWDEPNDRLRHIFGPEMWRSELMDLTLKVPNHCVGLSLREQTVQGSNRYQYHHLLFNSVSPCLQYAACAPFACRLGRVLGLCPKTNTARGIAS